jgi:pimeloyl-ACP methyl ester carboxylesterase
MAGNSASAKNIVLVHGGFVDGSGWRGVYDILKRDGHNVSIVQNPTMTLSDDVAATKRVIDAQDGPVTLVGHSYGGAVITEAGNDPKVSELVYICAFAPDEGESVNDLINRAPASAPAPPILPPTEGYLALDKSKFADSFAGDVDAASAAFMADSQVPWGVNALGETVQDPAWKNKPSWYLITTQDKMIPPEVQQFMCDRAGSTVTRADSSHSVYVSKPDAVAAFVEQAAHS